ncbi:hypothetical protein SLEP1_g6354 [Rubroshorea leprosula]|uniref:At1g61320/AtMIF1 LRR domain-containing protein n=1 Tax=Rubroshorea leprosula TaxID=152421 RepID=A0AAV5HZH9_9ROSI|nr:hypothetical protein SLEP1_g6354 [Rubroshorea leprosula]
MPMNSRRWSKDEAEGWPGGWDGLGVWSGSGSSLKKLVLRECHIKGQIILKHGDCPLLEDLDLTDSHGFSYVHISDLLRLRTVEIDMDIAIDETADYFFVASQNLKKITDQEFHSLLLQLPLLEELYLFNCHGLRRINISASPRLKTLQVCPDFVYSSLEMIEIAAWSLKNFIFIAEAPKYYKIKVADCCCGLKTLVLLSATITNNAFDELLSKFPQLENLWIIGCEKLQQMIKIPSLQLKRLHTTRCFELKVVEVCSPNLRELHYTGDEAPMFFLHTYQNGNWTFERDQTHSGWWCSMLQNLLKEVVECVASLYQKLLRLNRALRFEGNVVSWCLCSITIHRLLYTQTSFNSPDSLCLFMLVTGNILNHSFVEPRSCKTGFRCKARDSRGVAIEKWKRDGVYIDKQGKLRTFNHKKLSRKRCGSLRGQGWKYGSGFVDGIFPVLSPIAQQILNFLQKEVDPNRIWGSFDTLPSTHATWDDLINVAVQLRLNKKWDAIMLIGEWILYRSSFQPDVIGFNLLIDAYGQKSLYKKAESTYQKLLEARCIPTEDTYALLLKAYCTCGLLPKAEAVFAEMRKYGLPPSAVVYTAYIDGLMKGGNPQKAIEVFQRMKKDCCQPSTETYTLMINLYGKASKSYMSLKLFDEMRSQKCKPNICTYTALVNAFAREGLCEKAEEIFEQLQEAGLEPDVYAYNALMEAYSRAGYPYGAAEIFSLMQHMGCEPDRASFNIMVDAYGRAGLHEDAEAVFEEMKRLGITPTMKSHMLLLSAYSRTGNIAKCEDIVNQMQNSGLQPDTFVLNSMLNLYGRLGQFEKMEEVLIAMEKGPYTADISTYNILINIYGRAGFFERMEEIFQSLPGKSLKPDVVTWTSRLGAYSRKKLYRRCLEIFEEMIDAGCYPDGGTAKVLLSACSNEDQIEQVTTVIRTMHKDMKTVLPI